MVIANPVQPLGLVQPPLAGLEEITPVTPDLPVARETTRRVERAVAADRRGVAARPRRRYWSVRDLSRRLWVGRGYELLRELIRAGILPAARSTRSWWIDDEDAAGLIAAFEDRAGKVRAFRGLDAWLRERCFVAPLTPESETLVRLTRSGFAWRAHVYLPRAAWTAQVLEDGALEYRHRDGAVVAGLLDHPEQPPAPVPVEV